MYVFHFIHDQFLDLIHTRNGFLEVQGLCYLLCVYMLLCMRRKDDTFGQKFAMFMLWTFLTGLHIGMDYLMFHVTHIFSI